MHNIFLCYFVFQIILDIDDQRAPLYLYNYLTPKDFSDLEWRQHFCNRKL